MQVEPQGEASNDDLVLRHVAVPEWDALDRREAQFGAPPLVDETAADAMLAAVTLRLPSVLTPVALRRPPAAKTGIPVDAAPDTNYHYALVEVPLSIIVPLHLRLVRLALTVDLETDSSRKSIVRDLAPTSEYIERALQLGEVSLDIAKALNFVLPSAGDVLGLKLGFPLKWTSSYPQVQAAGRNSTSASWLVMDEAVREGFSAYLIIGAISGSPTRVRAQIMGELRHKTLGVVRRATFASDDRWYTLPPPARRRWWG
jgi:hypothetical protein